MSKHQPLDEWIDAMCRIWGIQHRRWLLPGPDTPTAHPESVFARIRDAIPPETFARQHFPEHLRGDALTIQRHLALLTDRQRDALTVHYIVPGLIKQKLPVINWSHSTYWQHLGAANGKLARALRTAESTASENAVSHGRVLATVG